jgi:hypothetical protein
MLCHVLCYAMCYAMPCDMLCHVLCNVRRLTYNVYRTNRTNRTNRTTRITEGYVVKTITTDNGGEYWSKQTESGELLVDEETLAQFENVCQNNGTGLPITHIKTAGPNHSDMNPIAERYNRKIMDIANAQMYHAKLSTGFWEWSVRHAVYLINRIPLKFHAKYHKSKTAYELITRQVASYSRIRTFGCDMYQRLPKIKKSQSSIEKPYK